MTVENLIELLFEAKSQIEYLQWKFKETGSGNNTIYRIEKALNEVFENDVVEIREKKELLKRVDELEKKRKEEKEAIILDALEIGSELHKEHLLQAIKLYKELTGAGLKESKDFIESIHYTKFRKNE